MSDHSSPLADSPPSGQSTSSPAKPGVHNLARSVCTFDYFQYEADEGIFRASYPSHVTAPSIAVVSALAAVRDTDPMAIGPLHEAIDTDALDTILTQGPIEGADVDVSFAVEGYEVSLGTGGTLSIRPPETTDA